MQRFLFERKKDQREFPLLDTKLEQWRLWALLIFMSLGIILWVAVANALYFKNFWIEVIFDDLIPVAIIISVIMYLSKGELAKLFGKPRAGDFGFAIIMFALQLGYSLFATSQLRNLGVTLGENASATQIENAANHSVQYFQDIFSDFFDLMGEELLSIIIFLTVAALLIQYYGFHRRTALGIAMLVSMFLFGMVHFQAYNWNLVQMLVIIAGERFFLTSIFVRSKTIWPSYIAHMVFDALAFGIAMR